MQYASHSEVVNSQPVQTETTADVIPATVTWKNEEARSDFLNSKIADNGSYTWFQEEIKRADRLQVVNWIKFLKVGFVYRGYMYVDTMVTPEQFKKWFAAA